jgi:hypothetical protein
MRDPGGKILCQRRQARIKNLNLAQAYNDHGESAGTRLISPARPLSPLNGDSSGGGAAVYGSDAMGGVINYLFKDDFEGLGFDASIPFSSGGDGTTWAFTRNF